MGWWRSYVRSKTKPIPVEYARKMKSRLSMIYLFAAWNAFALGVYYLFKENFPKTEEEEKYPSKYYARLLASDKAKVMRFSGFTLVDEYEIEAAEKPQRGRTWIEREKEDRERAEREREESERKNRQDLNLLVEETSSL